MKTLNNKYRLCTETKLKDDNFLSKLDAFYSSGDDGFFEGQVGIKIYYKYFLQKKTNIEKGAILISNGRTEFALKYKEIIYDLFNNGYSVYLIDHRGQGYSDRIYTEDRELGHVDCFQYYVDDLKSFYELKIKSGNHKKLFMLGHSLGGAISVLYLEQFPNDFNATTLTSPMLGFDFPQNAAINFNNADLKKYVIGKGNYNESLEPFAENTTTSSSVRYQILLNLNDKFPRVKLGGPSYQWVLEAIKAVESIFQNVDNIKIPLLLFHGSNEQIVSPKSHDEFIELLKRNKKSVEAVTIEGAKHELLIEKDLYRIHVMTKILDFLNNY